MKINDTLKIGDFLNILHKQGTSFRIDQQSLNAIMVSVAYPGLRLEVEFFDDHIEYSTFKGDEAVRDDTAELLKIVEKYKD